MLNGKWMAAFLALIALGTGAEKVPAAVDAVRGGDGAKCNVTYNHELSPEARKFAADVLVKLPPECSLKFELKGANGAHVTGRVRPEPQ